MNFKHNIGAVDKALRLTLGLFIVALGVYYQTWWGLIGLVPLVTAFVNFCPLYQIFGISTRRRSEYPH